MLKSFISILASVIINYTSLAGGRLRITNASVMCNYIYQVEPTTLADLDRMADTYFPACNVYNLTEVNKIRSVLERQVKLFPKNLVLHWALLKSYTNQPDFNSGNMNIALKYANYIFSINEYIGCIATEYVYNRSYQIEKAEEWYRRSLDRNLPANMDWQEIKYAGLVFANAKVAGNFNNWKLQNLYRSGDGTYSRRVMVAARSKCIYKCIIDFKRVIIGQASLVRKGKEIAGI